MNIKSYGMWIVYVGPDEGKNRMALPEVYVSEISVRFDPEGVSLPRVRVKFSIEGRDKQTTVLGEDVQECISDAYMKLTGEHLSWVTLKDGRDYPVITERPGATGPEDPALQELPF